MYKNKLTVVSFSLSQRNQASRVSWTARRTATVNSSSRTAVRCVRVRTASTRAPLCVLRNCDRRPQITASTHSWSLSATSAAASGFVRTRSACRDGTTTIT